MQTARISHSNQCDVDCSCILTWSPLPTCERTFIDKVASVAVRAPQSEMCSSYELA